MKVKCSLCRNAKTQKLPNIEKVNDEKEIFCNTCGKFLAIADHHSYPIKWVIDQKYTLIIA